MNTRDFVLCVIAALILAGIYILCPYPATAPSAATPAATTTGMVVTTTRHRATVASSQVQVQDSIWNIQTPEDQLAAQAQYTPTQDELDRSKKQREQLAAAKQSRIDEEVAHGLINSEPPLGDCDRTTDLPLQPMASFPINIGSNVSRVEGMVGYVNPTIPAGKSLADLAKVQLVLRDYRGIVAVARNLPINKSFSLQIDRGVATATIESQTPDTTFVLELRFYK